MQERRRGIRGTKRWSIGLSNVIKEKVAGKAGENQNTPSLTMFRILTVGRQ